MAYARLVDVKFKPGKREEGLRIIADIGRGVREGFEGLLILLPDDDPDGATYLTLWDSEETMNGSWEKINPRVKEALRDIMVGPPQMRRGTVRETQKLTIPA